MIDVSVIIPVYNAEAYLLDTIQSVRNQSMKNIEIILYDDGSIDRSRELCIQEKNKDQRITVISDENKGPAIARNRGINAARGKYIVFIDSDDMVNDDYIETLFKVAESTGSDFVMSGYTKQKKSMAETFSPLSGYYNSTHISVCLPEYVEKGLIQGPCWKLFRRDIITKFGIKFNEKWRLGEDAYFVYSYLKHIDNFSTIDYAGYTYIVRSDNSLSTRFTKEKIENNIILSQMLHDLSCPVQDIDWIGKSLCGNFVSFCDDTISLEEDYKKKIQIILWAIKELKKSDIFITYHETHKMRKTYRFLAVNNKPYLIYGIAICRKIIKKFFLKK